MKKLMKTLVVLLMVVVCIICSTFGIFADSSSENKYQIDGVTVIFDTNSQLSKEQQETIAHLLVNPEYGVAQVNLICNIFGHKNTSETVVTITHKVNDLSPRCLQENFIVTTCSRCNESTVERASYFYITCCPVE